MDFHNPKDDRGVERVARERTRRAFLTLGLGAVAGYGGWAWLRSRPLEGEAEWPMRRVLRANERIAGAYFSNSHRSPELSPAAVNPRTRKNGDIGLGDDFSPDRWSLVLNGLGASGSRKLGLSEIQDLPRIEQITQLNCIEGWTVAVHWTGARLADLTAKYAPDSRAARYVSMMTPDEAYFVGLDAASAMHPQTLLCYEMNGKPLTSEHGAPLRLVIPVKYGVKNIKRIGSIHFQDERPQDYWANEGYDWYAGL